MNWQKILESIEKMDKDKVSEAFDELLKSWKLTNQDVIDSVKQAIEEEDKNVHFVKGNYAERINKIISKNKDLQDGKFIIRVIKEETINAYAYPDGNIRIYSGLMDYMEDDELTFIIGHEMGHVVHQHILKQYKHDMQVEAGKKIVEASSKNTIIKKLGRKVLENYLNRAYSRSEEYEADKYGLYFVVKNGYMPESAARALEKLVELSNGERSNLVERMFATHPESEARAKRIRKNAKLQEMLCTIKH